MNYVHCVARSLRGKKWRHRRKTGSPVKNAKMQVAGAKSQEKGRRKGGGKNQRVGDRLRKNVKDTLLKERFQKP